MASVNDVNRDGTSSVAETDDAAPNRAPRPQRFGVLLGVLTAAFIISGVDRSWAQVLGVALTALLVIVGFRNSGYSTSRPLLVLLCTVVLSATLMIAAFHDESQWRALPMFLQAGVLALLVWMAVRAALRRAVVDMQTILAAICAYVLIGFVYAWAYLGIEVLDANQFSMSASDSTAFFEFSFVVQTTLGFGNQLPVSAIASRIVVTQAVIGQMFLATLVARLVSLYGTNARAQSTNRP